MLPRELPKFSDDIDLDPDFARKLDEAFGQCITNIDIGPGLYGGEDGPNRVLLYAEEPNEQAAEITEVTTGGGDGCTVTISQIGIDAEDDVSSGCLPGLAEWKSAVADPPVAVDDLPGGQVIIDLSTLDCDEFFTIKPGPGIHVTLTTDDGAAAVGDETRQYEIGLAGGTEQGEILYWNGSAWCLLDPPDDTALYGLTIQNKTLAWTPTSACPTS